MAEKSNPVGKIKVSQAIWPVLLGLGVVAFLFYREFNPAVFNDFHITWRSIMWIFISFACIFGRDLGYVIRLRILSRKVAGEALSWGAALRVIMLWEFTSAITPGAVGGTSVAIVYVNKEGISVGRSSTIVMLTSFLDELYFLIMFPLLLAFVGIDNLFNITVQGGILAKGLMSFALIGYILKFAFTTILAYGLFINPRGLKLLILKVFKVRWLRRWRMGANVAGYEIVASSENIKRFGAMFWMKAFGATFLSWSSRYLVANALIIAFFAVSDNFLLFARQLVMWIMMLVLPTPGGSGFAELVFTNYCSDLISVPLELQLSAAALIAFMWRGVTYYPYLAVGAVLFPRWIKRHFGKKESNDATQ